jgi:pimeloyl-ACP methyl ester carboxylesterase
MSSTEPFRIAVPDAVLDDLAARLARVRAPAAIPAGESAETVARIEELIAYWRDGYDWRAAERRLNAVPQYRAVVGGTGLHYLHVPGTGPAPLPLLLVNGWPSSFVEYLGVLDRLADPVAYGGDPGDAFSVVVPALPGYGFSDPYPSGRVDRVAIAGLFDRLMVETLGHPSYVAHGDDIGGGVVNRLGMRHTGTVRAVQTANWLHPRTDPAYAEGLARWERERGAYAHVQATRPWTLSYGLNDSPAGLAAWILEKFLTWSDPATREGLSADDLLTTVMIYWVTGSIGSSVGPYAVDGGPPVPGDVVRAPASIVVTREPELPVPSESALREVYPALTSVTRVASGGHFLALEAPEVFVERVRSAFRPYR